MCVGGHALLGGACHLSPGGYIQQKCGTGTSTSLSATLHAGIPDGLPEKGMYRCQRLYSCTSKASTLVLVKQVLLY